MNNQSEESAEEILQSVASEIDSAEAAEVEQLAERAAAANASNIAAGDSEDEESGKAAHNSSAAVLEISQGSSDFSQQRMESGQGSESPQVAAAAGVSAIAARSPDGAREPQRARAATMPGAQSPARGQGQELTGDPGPGSGLQVVGVDANVAAPSFFERLSDATSWSITKARLLKQQTLETLGSATRTTDTKLSDRLITLMAQREKYNALLKVALRLCAQVRDIKTTQRELANVLGTFSARSEELGKEVETNASTQRLLARNGDVLYEALSTFCANLTHLLNTAMEDTFKQLKIYQSARLEFDAYRNGEASARASAEASPSDESRKIRLERKVQELDERKRRFESLRKDLTVRVHFLEQNQLKVMTRQLTLLHNASCAYFTGNSEQLEKCIRQFHIKMPQHLGQDATAVSPSASAAAATAASASASTSASLEPLPFPTPTELGTPSDALSALLTSQLTTADNGDSRENGDDGEGA
eukprot:scpid75442/ scgid10257/ Arfaptin-1; ADP-ribosylation factor-interacting protein 1